MRLIRRKTLLEIKKIRNNKYRLNEKLILKPLIIVIIKVIAGPEYVVE